MRIINRVFQPLFSTRPWRDRRRPTHCSGHLHWMRVKKRRNERSWTRDRAPTRCFSIVSSFYPTNYDSLLRNPRSKDPRASFERFSRVKRGIATAGQIDWFLFLTSSSILLTLSPWQTSPSPSAFAAVSHPATRMASFIIISRGCIYAVLFSLAAATGSIEAELLERPSGSYTATSSDLIRLPRNLSRWRLCYRG